MRLIKLLSLTLLALIAVLAVNTLRLPALPAAAASATVLADIDEAAAAERLGAAIRIPTISRRNGERSDVAAFAALTTLLETQYPNAHRVMTREAIGDSSLLFTWTGKDAAAPPALFLAHMDVVPVEPGTEARWTHPAFGGVVADGFIWGRGTLDDKLNVLGLMEAAEALAAQGWQPPYTLIFAFGHDEEVGGHGAQAIAASLEQRGIHAAFLLDEGGALTVGLMPGISRPVATIMAAEKGYASFRLTASAIGGHSSQPPPDTAVTRLARALVRLQDRPLPARLAAPVDVMLERAAPAMGLVHRVAIANRWLFEPLLLKLLADAPASNAMIRTTTAPTMLHAGIKDNVLPAEASAVINFRLLPGDSLASVEAHIRKAIADDGIAITLEGGTGNAATAVSDPDSAAFRHLADTTRTVFPDAVVTTGLMLGATDARHYEGLYDNRYNFMPVILNTEDLQRIHGANERIAVADYAKLIRWYRLLLEGLGV
ncbi:M20 family peptidase [Nevskia sp.]|uniref:M20 family peptidase n=1 Tax=Nevskia sp. TaxID=1929292 RepID=UPI0025F96428|nr:M20 family peptidase [Nevskia sp.]